MLACLPLIYFLAVSAPTVDSVRIAGADRTRPGVIYDELETRRGATFSPGRWERDVRRVDDLGIFWTVASTRETLPGNRVALTLDIHDKWTLLPILQYTQIAGSYQLIAGVWDVNFLGRGVEAGIEYTQKRAGKGVDAWVYEQRIGSTPLYFDVDAAYSKDDRLLYTGGDRDVIEMGYGEFRRYVALEFGSRLNKDGTARVGLVMRPYATSFDPSSRPPPLNPNADFRLTNDRVGLVSGLRITAGKLHYFDLVWVGVKLDMNLSLYLQRLGTPSQYLKSTAIFTWMTSPRPRHNLGIRAVAGTVGSPRIEDGIPIGGLTEIRGFPDERFRGRQAAWVNVEYRYPLLDNHYLLVQGVPYTDMAAWVGQFTDRNENGFAQSVGGGLRFIIKPIYNMLLRFDAVERLTPGRLITYSLGSRQFF